MAKQVAPRRRGAFIVLEGIDRSGKTTQSTKLVDALNELGIPAVYMRFPDRTTASGKIINSYLASATNLGDNAIHLLFSANRWEAKESILKALNEGKTVVVDRYAYSGVAYTAAKGVPLEWCKASDKGLPSPDLVVYLKISVEDTMKRGNFGNERYETEDFQRKVKRIYEEEIMRPSWQVIDATQDSKTIQAQLAVLVWGVFIKVADGPPIGELVL